VRTIMVVKSGRDYFIDGIFWGDDEEGVRRYLQAKGVSPAEIVQAVAEVVQTGRSTIQQED
jgi:hypothetical protein